MNTMIDALRIIVSKSPSCMSEAAKMLASWSRIKDKQVRYNVVAGHALQDRQAEFTPADRFLIASRIDAGDDEGPRTLDVRVRVTEAEKRSVQEAAALDGHNVSDYIRQKIGL